MLENIDLEIPKWWAGQSSRDTQTGCSWNDTLFSPLRKTRCSPFRPKPGDPSHWHLCQALICRAGYSVSVRRLTRRSHAQAQRGAPDLHKSPKDLIFGAGLRIKKHHLLFCVGSQQTIFWNILEPNQMDVKQLTSLLEEISGKGCRSWILYVLRTCKQVCSSA